MNRILVGITAAGLVIASNGMAFAQEKEGKIQRRKENQQKRIGEGIEKGSLTPKEAGRLEHKETKLNQEIRRDRRENGGNLTNKEKRRINRQQNRISKDIHRDKHNGAVQQ
jgi:hypothetical protein